MKGAVHVAEQHVATRLVRLSLRRDGSLPRSALLASTVRAAVLADLALYGALTDSPSGLGLDTTPTGFVPADNLLTAVAARPDKNTEWWLRRGTDAVHDTVADLLATGVWTRHLTGLSHHYRDTDPASARADAARVHAAFHDTRPDTPATAVLVGLIGVIGFDDEPAGQYPAESVLFGCGQARWLMGDLIEYLLARRRLLDASAADARVALSVNFLV